METESLMNRIDSAGCVCVNVLAEQGVIMSCVQSVRVMSIIRRLGRRLEGSV